MSEHAKKRTIEILLADDSPGDVRLTQEAFKQTNMQTEANLNIVKDGVEALEFLHRHGAYRSAPQPDLILLDLDMPRKDGHSVLAEIKSDTHLKHIPVIILTHSQAEQDINTSYSMNANCYIHKPLDFNAYTKVIETLQSFWLKSASLPTSHANEHRE